jgi:nitrogen fixation protein FixH
VPAKLGWGAQILASDFNAVEGRARFQLLVTDANGPLDAVVVQLTLTRPLEGNSLPTVSLPVEAGRAQVTLNGLRPGQWAARMVIRQGEAQAVIEQRMILK